MGKWRLLLAFSLLMAGSAQAASGHGNAAVEHMAHTLGLNDEQRVKVEVIMSDQHQARKDMRAESGGRLDCNSKLALWDATRDRLLEVLTTEQINQYDEMQSRRIERCSKIEKHRRNS